MKLPKAEQSEPSWQTAVRELMIAAERNGIMTLAELAMPSALHHAEPPPALPAPRRKRGKAYKIVR
jgi:hypothetical protein